MAHPHQLGERHQYGVRAECRNDVAQPDLLLVEGQGYVLLVWDTVFTTNNTYSHSDPRAVGPTKQQPEQEPASAMLVAFWQTDGATKS